MTITVKDFVANYKDLFEVMYVSDYTEGTVEQQYHVLGSLVRSYLYKDWRNTRKHYKEEKVKQVFYFSMEFLPGQQLTNNLYKIGLLDTVREGLEELDLDYEQLEAAEVDPALGNGGLGRLASCFMDSFAALGIPGHGNGIRYQYGLFEQKFVDGHQVEVPDHWLRRNNVWETRNEQSSFIVRMGGKVWMEEDKQGHLIPQYEDTLNILAVPYDTPAVGYRNNMVNNIRLWSAEVPEEEESNYTTIESRREIDEIVQVLYPDDSDYEGRLLRLKQEYFMVSAGIQSIMKHFNKYNEPRTKLPEYVSIHINDTHPALAIPELMRILLDEEHLSWESAWEITRKVCSYTNHTILQEALEKWPVEMVKELLPRIYLIIEEINRRHIEEVKPLYGEVAAHETAIIQEGMVHMAHLSIIGSYSVNGVARLHSEILKSDTLHAFYSLYPDRFNNKTNGITHRRWIHQANERLSALLNEKIGEQWRTSPSELKVLKGFIDDEDTLKDLAAIKRKNKEDFAQMVKEEYDLEISTDAIFDVQIKRLHAYKRQHLNALHILSRYLYIKENPDAQVQPRVFIFGAKAAPSYTYAKEIIKVINTLAEVVNNDPEVGDKLKIVFVENYGVSYAQKIIPAADVSEQISLAGKEASGTSNMKLMSNGALTIATLDGANVEINQLVGDENMFLFGLNADEVNELRPHYHPNEIYQTDERIHKVLNALIDGTLPGAEEEGRSVFNSLVHYGDEYFVLEDFNSYVEAHERIDELYADEKAWNQKVLYNIAESGPFSSDFTIKQYADEIWQVHSYAAPGKGVQLVDRESILKTK
ncbi:MAG TPA: glycogen/starch/alpha-glucan phosphorylase [Atopostipes sp.]|nr:glycogen/starch/alpha-glucan phosphorylase [Atopostipes sp.]